MIKKSSWDLSTNALAPITFTCFVLINILSQGRNFQRRTNNKITYRARLWFWRTPAGYRLRIDDPSCFHRHCSTDLFSQFGSRDCICYDDVDSCSLVGFVKVNWWLNCFDYPIFRDRWDTDDSAAGPCSRRGWSASGRRAAGDICARVDRYRVRWVWAVTFRRSSHFLLRSESYRSTFRVLKINKFRQQTYSRCSSRSFY